MHFADLGDEARQIIRFASRYAAAADYQIGFAAGAAQRSAQRSRIVAQAFMPHERHAVLLEHCTQGMAIAVVDLAELQRLTRSNQFVAGRQQNRARTADDIDVLETERSECAESCRRKSH